MSVRYVLTAVLPRYTMRRPTGAAPAAVADRPVRHPAKPITFQQGIVGAKSDGSYARVMDIHDQVRQIEQNMYALLDVEAQKTIDAVERLRREP